MEKKLLDFIRHLSIEDKKTLSQKALKVSEECGELAKAVLPYDNAPGTNHRFIDKKSILEEVSDVLLTAISIAYSLNYTDEDIQDMLEEKSIKWQELQNKEKKVTYPIPYEIHITVEKPEIDLFKEACGQAGVKPIVIDLERNSESVMIDVMTSSKFFGDNRGAFEEVKRLSKVMSGFGFKVIREKIETIPWHPAAPSINDNNPEMPPGCYFESHISVICVNQENKNELAILAKDCGAHMSKNFFKKLEHGKFINMVTLREYDKTYESFLRLLDNLKDVLSYYGFKFEKEIVEFNIFDTKMSHDFNWLKQTV
jgi:NTP pyrophosphatase (non-canonical NTP hydrolase)